ncbi:MAG: VWA domain-containing protein [Desulfamplus sp.]|nr:VWA domain-containing protein [Desulfamplus sp.]
MLDIMIQFTACCRSYGLRVSTSEVLDCIRHLTLINPLDEREFKTVLLSNYAKSRRDQSRFNSLYDLFFHGITDINPENSFTHLSSTFNKIIDLVEKKQDNDLTENALTDNTSINHASTYNDATDNAPTDNAPTDNAPTDNAPTDKDLTQKALTEFMRGKPAEFLNLIHKLNIMSVKQQKFFKSNMDQLSAKLGIMLAINQMRQRIMTLTGSHFDNLDQESIKLVNRHFANMLDHAYALLTDEPRENNDSLVEKKSQISATSEIGQKPFSSLSSFEVAKVMEVIEIFARKLKDQASRRFRIKKRGAIDIKKTLRHSGKYQGVPLDIKFKDKALNKSSIIILCDISGSVWSSARFMLNVLYALQECFSRVKSFVFVAQLAEVTDYFQNTGTNSVNGINTAIDKILNSNIINTSEHTDYGAVFSTFKKEQLHLLNHKTTVIIMGDGRSNYLNPQAHMLAEIREKCRRIIWLNPEPHNTWNSGDSEIFAYKIHCHEIRTCMNLNHLTQFVRELVL